MKGVGGTGKQVGKNVGRKGGFPRASNNPESFAPRMTGLGVGGVGQSFKAGSDKGVCTLGERETRKGPGSPSVEGLCHRVLV